MGQLINGVWNATWSVTQSQAGAFVREEAKFDHWVTPDGSAGPTGKAGFKAAAGQYHLYVAWACPWAHRTLIVRALKGLQKCIDISVVDPFMGDNGWMFCAPDGSITEGSTHDALYGARYLHEIYTRAVSRYTGRVTVPILWDKERETIVSNASEDIVRMLGSAFDGCGGNDLDLYPAKWQADIDTVNTMVYERVNNGVYKAGFATSQKAYEEAFHALFRALDELEARLSEQASLVGNVLTEADVRLFTTLYRFDAVYHGHFKCNGRRLSEYPHLWEFTQKFAQLPAVVPTLHMDQVKAHYYRSHKSINPSGVVAAGPLYKAFDKASS